MRVLAPQAVGSSRAPKAGIDRRANGDQYGATGIVCTRYGIQCAYDEHIVCAGGFHDVSPLLSPKSPTQDCVNGILQGVR